MGTTTAPWTAEQVEKLNEYQNCEWVHEFTCPNHNDFDHQQSVTVIVPANAADMEDGTTVAIGGQLVARLDGFHCFVCGYHQTWAHDFMLFGAPPRPSF